MALYKCITYFTSWEQSLVHLSTIYAQDTMHQARCSTQVLMEGNLVERLPTYSSLNCPLQLLVSVVSSAWGPFYTYLLLYFWDSVFLLSQDCPEKHCVAQGSLKFSVILFQLCEYYILVLQCLTSDSCSLYFSSRLSTHVAPSDKPSPVPQDLGRSLMICICFCLGFLLTLALENSILVGLFCSQYHV